MAGACSLQAGASLLQHIFPFLDCLGIPPGTLWSSKEAAFLREAVQKEKQLCWVLAAMAGADPAFFLGPAALPVAGLQLHFSLLPSSSCLPAFLMKEVATELLPCNCCRPFTG